MQRRLEVYELEQMIHCWIGTFLKIQLLASGSALVGRRVPTWTAQYFRAGHRQRDGRGFFCFLRKCKINKSVFKNCLFLFWFVLFCLPGGDVELLLVVVRLQGDHRFSALIQK